MNYISAYIDSFDEEQYENEIKKLTEQEKIKIKNYSNDDKKRTLAGRIILRKLIKKYYNQEDYTFSYNKNGKPLLDFCFFNISHCENLVCAAISDSEIGIDVEKIKPFKIREKYMMFSKEESDYANSVDDGFFVLWTMKEAYIKANGFKLSDMSQTNFVNSHGELLTSYNQYFLNVLKNDGFIITICNYLKSNNHY